MNSVKRHVRVVAGLAMLVAAAGCSTVRQPVPTVTALLVDQSIVSPTMRAEMTTIIKSVIWRAKPGSVIEIIPVSANSTASAGGAVPFTFPEHSPMDNPLDYNAAVNAVRTAALNEAITLLSPSVAHQSADGETDLLGAFGAAASFLNGDTFCAVSDKQLIIVSDGIHQTRECDFLKIRFSPKENARIIREQSVNGQLADLRGVKVWVAGVGGSEASTVSPSQFAAIECFWIADFQAMHANVSPTRYGGTLENYP